MTTVVQMDSGFARELGETLDEAGYGEFLAACPPGRIDPGLWWKVAQRTEGPLRAVVGLLLLGESVRTEALTERLRAMVDHLMELDLCDAGEGSTVRLPGLVLVRVQGLWLFAQGPQLSPTLYLGDDSLALAHHLSIRRGQRVLDLCAGPGMQALASSLWANHVVAVEVNPVAAALCRVNAAINGREDLIEVRCGDLYAVVPERFDRIVANPPLLPMPARLPYPFVGHGGADGLCITRRILDGLPGHLAPGGSAQVIATMLSDGLIPLGLDELEAWAVRSRCDLLLTITAHAEAGPQSRLMAGLSRTVAARTDLPIAEIQNDIASHYARNGASHLCAAFIRAGMGGGSLRLVDVSGENGAGFWFAS